LKINKCFEGDMMLNDNEQKLLSALENNPYISQIALAHFMGLSRSATANMISGLQEKGYILGKPYVLRKKDYLTCVGASIVDHGFSLIEDMILSTSNPVESSYSFGGVARNIAENLARLDQDVSMMSVVGKDSYGDELLSFSRRMMNTMAIDQIDGAQTGSYYSVIDKSGNMVVGFADMAINKSMNRTWIIEHKKHLNMGKWIISDMNISVDAMEALLDFSNEENKLLAIVGVSGPKMKNLPKVLKGLELIIVNVDETQAYFNTDSTDLTKLADLWYDKGIRNVVVTAGSKGCIYRNSKERNLYKAFSVKKDLIKDVTGAGDAFSAAVIYGLVNGESLKESVSYGTASASLTIQSDKSVYPELSIRKIIKEISKNEEL
jgi:sugar/nucleoside kinase (ribokinase family)